MRIAIINNKTNLVESVAVGPEEVIGDLPVEEGYTAVALEGADVGDKYEDGKIIKPPEEAPGKPTKEYLRFMAELEKEAK